MNTNEKIYEIGRTIGLNKKEISSILNDTPIRNEQFYFNGGPIDYLSSLYGTISTKDFFIRNFKLISNQ